MALPVITIPEIPVLTQVMKQVPVDIHPCVIHLAVALPIVIVLIELINLFTKKRALGVFSFILMILLAVVLAGAYLTGTVDAEHAKNALSVGGAKNLFEAHKLQAVYLVYGALVLVVIKLLAVLIRKMPMRIIFLIFLIAFTALTVNTAKKGKELVFKYGINVKAVQQSSSVTTPNPTATRDEVPMKKEATEASIASPTAATETQSAASSVQPMEKSAVDEVEKAVKTVEKGTESMKEKAEQAVEKATETETAPLQEAPEAPEAPNAPDVPTAQQ